MISVAYKDMNNRHSRTGPAAPGNYEMLDRGATKETGAAAQRDFAASNGGAGAGAGAPLGDEKNAHELKQYPTNADDERRFHLEHAATYATTYEQEFRIYGNEGELILIPAASRDPKDPLNLPLPRKIAALFFLSFFGALAASAEIILGACLPVFALQYSDLFPNPGKYLEELVDTQGGFASGSNPLKLLNHLGKGPSIFAIYMLAAAPLLVIGVANLFLVPVAIAIGRRPVLLFTSCVAIGGACWAGASKDFANHLAARCLQAVGAGTVESLIPFIIQDMVHVHERNTWISAAFATQGVIIIAIGFSTPYIIVELSWHWVYFITAASAGFFLIGIFFFLPETRWNRTRSEMGKCCSFPIKDV